MATSQTEKVTGAKSCSECAALEQKYLAAFSSVEAAHLRLHKAASVENRDMSAAGAKCQDAGEGYRKAVKAFLDHREKHAGRRK
jgi:hypothetical protein